MDVERVDDVHGHRSDQLEELVQPVAQHLEVLVLERGIHFSRPRSYVYQDLVQVVNRHNRTKIAWLAIFTTLLKFGGILLSLTGARDIPVGPASPNWIMKVHIFSIQKAFVGSQSSLPRTSFTGG